jgi:hypothetical protein
MSPTILSILAAIGWASLTLTLLGLAISVIETVDRIRKARGHGPMRPRHEHQHPTRRSFPRSTIRNDTGSIVVSQPVAGNQRHGMLPAGALIIIRDQLLPVADSGNGILPLGHSRAHSQAFEHGVHRLADRHPVLIALVIHAANLSQA